jgi:hypothetical protein
MVRHLLQWPQWLTPAALLAVTASALAQPAPPAARPDPLNAEASVPPTQHRSAFASYRPQGEPALATWKDANDTVGRIGGWRSYARDAHPPAPPASAAGTAR